jgi:predicted metalloprotease with PDZ domain
MNISFARISFHRWIYVFFILFEAIAMSAAQTPTISYSLGMSKPSSHVLEISLRFAGLPNVKTLECTMPVWRTGRYVRFDFAGGVRMLSAHTAAGKPLPSFKKDQNSWVIETNGASDVIVSYELYANEVHDRTRGLDADHAFVDPAAAFMFAKKYQHLPLTLDVKPFPGWHVTTGLETAPGVTNRFCAPNYEVFADCPIEVGTQKDFEFDAEGKRHVLMIAGEGNWDAPTIIEDLKKIIKLFRDFWGGLPYERYVFMLHVDPNLGGGTEHLNSTIMQTQPFVFKNPGSYRGFLGLVAHEYFHTWNVKQIRPAAYHPYDLSTEGYSKELWIAEGTTSYYSPLLMMRGGYGSVTSYLDGIAASINGDRMRPGNRVQSLSESSFDAWIKFWRGRQDSFNAESDYYDKGSDVSQILDLEIRQRSGNKHSLDDVMRAMYQEFPLVKKGYTIDDFQGVCERLSDSNMKEFFSRYVHGTDALPWERALGYAGVQITPRSDGPTTFLGMSTYDSNGRTVIQRVLDSSPAADAGISNGDELIAMNNFRIRGSDLQSRIAEMKPGDVVRFALFRNDRLREVVVTLGTMPVPLYRIERAVNPTELQKAIFGSWLGTSWDAGQESKK